MTDDGNMTMVEKSPGTFTSVEAMEPGRWYRADQGGNVNDNEIIELLEQAHTQVGGIQDMSLRERLIDNLAFALINLLAQKKGLARTGKRAISDLTKSRARVSELEEAIKAALVEAGDEAYYDDKPHKAAEALRYTRRVLSEVLS